MLPMQTEYEIIGDVRGKGLAICVELVKDRTTKEPIDGKEFVGRLFRKGVLAVTGLPPRGWLFYLVLQFRVTHQVHQPLIFYRTCTVVHL
jgi:adenosylmethionine-8-amino-7-oxononanoate aminotransferase